MRNIFSKPDNLYDYEKLRESMMYDRARVGFINDTYDVFVHTDDPRVIPHFHIWDIETNGNKFHTAIETCNPNYALHVGNEDCIDCNLKQSLLKFLNEKSRNARFYNNWEYLLIMWNLNNSAVEVPEDTPIPNYLLLP